MTVTVKERMDPFPTGMFDIIRITVGRGLAPADHVGLPPR